MKNSSAELAYVVGIGASAGGLEALQDFFQHLPGDTQLAFVVIQHLSSDYKSVMDELLQRHTDMPISVVEQECPIEANHIYLISSRSNLVIRNQQLVPLDKDPQQRLNLPIDLFFHSLGEAFQEKAIGIVLSGTGTDGSRGIKTIKEYEGLVMVQHPQEARFDGMPNSVVNSGLADFVLGSAELAAEVSRLAQHAPWLHQADLHHPEEVNAELLKRVLGEVKKHCGIDFTLYRRQTVSRRLFKRLRVLNFNDLDPYYTYLTEHPSEAQRLSREFLIGVTRFFRDEEAWRLLTEKALPHLLSQSAPTRPLRIWVAGCSTGEEAYSLAILFDEFLHARKSKLEYKIFATDADEEVIQFASNGRYPDAIFTSVSTERLSRYFEKDGDSYVIKKQLRDRMLFARHNLLVDPPFLKQDLISCRNLLIYFQPETQRKILNSLHFSLRLGGVLFLGKSESLGSLGSRFKQLSPHINIFENIEATRSHQLILDNYLSQAPRPETALVAPLSPLHRPAGAETHFFEHALLDEFVPAVLFVTRQGEVLYTHGNLHPYILFPRGRVQYHLRAMMNEAEYSLIQSGMLRALQEKRPVFYGAVPLQRGNDLIEVNLTLRPLWYPDSDQTVFLLEFTPLERPPTGEVIAVQPSEFAQEQLTGLHHELRLKSQELSQLREKLETSNEELQASNEELLASNEELQSTNEELQSVNEELYTLNSELEAKIRSLTELNNDLDNFLNSAQIGMIFLDRDLQIRRYTPSIAKVFNFFDTDLGRPLRRFTFHFDQAFDLDEVCRQVLTTSQRFEREVSIEQAEYLLRILPYLTRETAVQGVVLSLVDITERNRMLRRAHVMDMRYKSIFNNMPDYLALVDASGCFRLINQGINPKIASLLVGKPLSELFGGNQADFLTEIQACLAGEPAGELITCQTLDGPVQWYVHRFCLLPGDEHDQPAEVIVVSHDITELRGYQEQIRLEADKLQRLLDSSNDMIVALTPKFRISVSNRGFQNFLARWFDVDQVPRLDALPDDTAGRRLLSSQLIDICRQALEGQSYQCEIRLSLPSGEEPVYQLQVTQMEEGPERSPRAVLAFRDTTREAQAHRQLQQAIQALERTNAYLDSFVYAAAHDLRSPIANLMSLIERLSTKTALADEPMFQLLEKSVHSLDQTLGGLIEIIDVQKLSDQPIRRLDLQEQIQQILLHYPGLNSGLQGEVRLDLEVKSIAYIEAYLRSILQNLIDNSYKYRKDSEKVLIEISSRQQQQEILLTVRDNGLGLPEHLPLDKLFRAFHRYHQQIEGKGIGLYLVKTLVEKNGGWVQAESPPDGGTRFILGLREYEQAHGFEA